jgi:LuxR family transcriptional regulator, quorum-sensing system regulator CciR
MTNDPLVIAQTFVASCNEVKEMQELRHLISDAVEGLGFRYFAIGEHRSTSKKGAYIDVSSYPEHWSKEYVTDQFFLDDPVIKWCNASITAFRWDELEQHMTLTKLQQEILHMGWKRGIKNGYTIPIHAPGRLPGSANFISDSNKFCIGTMAAAQMIGVWGFEAARRIQERRRDFKPVKLSRRQLQCMILAARGNSDWSIGQQLGISKETVSEHIDKVRAAYGVASRVQMTTRALYEGIFCFADVLDDGDILH